MVECFNNVDIMVDICLFLGLISSIVCFFLSVLVFGVWDGHLKEENTPYRSVSFSSSFLSYSSDVFCVLELEDLSYYDTCDTWLHEQTITHCQDSCDNIRFPRSVNQPDWSAGIMASE